MDDKLPRLGATYQPTAGEQSLLDSYNQRQASYGVPGMPPTQPQQSVAHAKTPAQELSDQVGGQILRNNALAGLSNTDRFNLESPTGLSSGKQLRLGGGITPGSAAEVSALRKQTDALTAFQAGINGQQTGTSNPVMGGSGGQMGSFDSPATTGREWTRPDMQSGALGYACGGKLRGYAEGGKIEGPGTSTSDSIDAEVQQTGEPIKVSTGERIVSKAQDALLLRLAKALGFKSVDDLLASGTGQPVGPTIKGGKKAAADGAPPASLDPDALEAMRKNIAAMNAAGAAQPSQAPGAQLRTDPARETHGVIGGPPAVRSMNDSDFVKPSLLERAMPVSSAQAAQAPTDPAPPSPPLSSMTALDSQRANFDTNVKNGNYGAAAGNVIGAAQNIAQIPIEYLAKKAAQGLSYNANLVGNIAQGVAGVTPQAPKNTQQQGNTTPLSEAEQQNQEDMRDKRMADLAEYTPPSQSAPGALLSGRATGGVTQGDVAASEMMRDYVDKATGTGPGSSLTGPAGMQARLTAYANNPSLLAARNAEEQLRGSGARIEKGPGGRMTITNSGDFDGSTKGAYTDLAGNPTSTFAGSQENQRGIADAQHLRDQLATMQALRYKSDATDPTITDHRYIGAALRGQQENHAAQHSGMEAAEGQLKNVQAQSAKRSSDLEGIVADPTQPIEKRTAAAQALQAIRGKDETGVTAHVVPGGTDPATGLPKAGYLAVTDKRGNLLSGGTPDDLAKRLAGNQAAGPKVGEVRNGFKFKGGDPSKQASWEKV